MTDKVHRIHSLPSDAPWVGGIPPEDDRSHPLTIRALDRVLAVQRPIVLAHLRSIRRRHRHSSPAEIVHMLERRYLAAVTTGGAAVGATAVVPGIGTGVTLALSGVETLGFLETTALFAQSVAEVHGIPIENPDRARALVLTLMLGQEGVDLVAQLAGQVAGRGPSRDSSWGEVITKTLPRASIGPLTDRLKTSFLHRFAVGSGTSWLGKALPFGVGAAVGGAGNHLLGRRVVSTARRAFGMPPADLPPALEPRPGGERAEAVASTRVARAGAAIAEATTSAARRTGRAVRRASSAVGSATGVNRRTRTRDDAERGAPEQTDAAPRDDREAAS